WPFEAAQPATLTFETAPDEENVTVARVTSSAPPTHALAAGITPRIAAWMEPCGGCSGTLWLAGLPAAGSGASVVGWLPPSAPTACCTALFRSPGFPGVGVGCFPAAVGVACATGCPDGLASAGGAAPAPDGACASLPSCAGLSGAASGAGSAGAGC